MNFVDKMKRLAQETREQRQTEADRVRAKQRHHLLGLISDYCARLSRHVKRDIERDARGLNTPGGRPEGRLVYSLNEILDQLSGSDAEEVEREYRMLTAPEIQATAGYRHLSNYCDKLGLEATLRKASSVSWEVRISGWG